MSQKDRSASSLKSGTSSNSSTLAASAEELKPHDRVMRTLSSVTTSVSPGSAPATANGPDCGLPRLATVLPWRSPPRASTVLVRTLSPGCTVSGGSCQPKVL